MQNIRLYSDIQIEGWERELDIAKSDGGVVIASISAHTASELTYLASKMEKFGADAIELSVSNPMMESLEVVASHADVIYDMTKEVVSNVRIPVIVKLSQNTTNITKVAKAAKKAGASAVSAINTVRDSGGRSGNGAAGAFNLWRYLRTLYPSYGACIGGGHRAVGRHSDLRDRRRGQCKACAGIHYAGRFCCSGGNGCHDTGS